MREDSEQLASRTFVPGKVRRKPKSGLDSRGRGKAAWRVRGPVIESGVVPASMRSIASANLKEAKPKAGSSFVQMCDEGRTADGSETQKSPPIIPGRLPFKSRIFPRQSVTPTKINRGGREA